MPERNLCIEKKAYFCSVDTRNVSIIAENNKAKYPYGRNQIYD